MKVTVRLFAILRERAGREAIELELAEGATVAAALDALAGEPTLAETLARLPVRLAVNRDYADADTTLAAGDELALVPPISGGAHAPTVHAAISEEPLDPRALERLLVDPAAGALVTFQGVTREVARLDYEAYREMAEERIAAILAEAAARHDLTGAAAAHRVGPVPRGEPGVVVVAAAGHREEAFAGAREAIDRIKAEAPIWKREVEASGAARWVEGTTP